MASVLIVDDSTLMRRNLLAMFKQGGHSVVAEASNGLEAVTEYEKHKPDFVTMDLNMPELDGVGAVKEIMARHPDAKIIMVTTEGDKEKVIEAIKAGAKSYILKPITFEKVMETLDKISK